MKRFTSAIILALTFVACSKYDGTDYFSPSYVSTPLKEYMLCISSDLVTASLVELESALNLDKEGTMAKYFYRTDGLSLSSEGSLWTVTREGPVQGATIAKVAGKTAWTIVFDGEFKFNGNKFATRFELEATAADPSAEGHRDWLVGIDGSRAEEAGYSCTFNHVETPVTYRAVADEESSWKAYGFLEMEVNKDDNRVDALIMELRGSVNSVSVAHL